MRIKKLKTKKKRTASEEPLSQSYKEPDLLSSGLTYAQDLP